MSAPKGNTNAEKWDLDSATKFMDEAVELSKDSRFDFIGEVAKEMDQYHHLFSYLADKFPELKTQERMIYSNCEANCFFNGKKNNIIPSMAIMNLKSNHGWTDRVDNTTKGEQINSAPLTKEERDQINNDLEKDY